jgi:WD40 repeat protein
VRLWDSVTGEQRRILSGGLKPPWLFVGLGRTPPPLYQAAFSPDGQLLASFGGQWELWLWDPVTGEARRILTGPGWVRSVAFSPDGRLLASGGNTDAGKGWVWLWDPVTGGQVRALTGHTKAVWSVTFSPDGRLLASGGDDNTVRLWDPVTGEQVRALTGHGWVWSVAFSPDGRLLASGGGRTVGLWDLGAPGRN